MPKKRMLSGKLSTELSLPPGYNELLKDLKKRIQNMGFATWKGAGRGMILGILLSFSSLAYSNLLEMETKDCVVCFLDDEFLVKQVKNPNPDEQFLLVLEATGCAIAESIDLPINRVKIIPPNTSFCGKKYLELPATLHTRVPGASVPESDLEVRIHQRTRKANIPSKWPLPPDREGLNPSIIANMAIHEDLPGIVALDTFVGNADRSQPNLFYDPATNRYFGIDLAASFCSELGKAACEQLRRFEAQKRQFSTKERAALTKYTNTLEQLMSLWPPEAIEALLLENAIKAGFEKSTTLLNRDVEERIIFHREVIQSNHASIVELVRLLKAFLSRP